jgi:hypothetical protein
MFKVKLPPAFREDRHGRDLPIGRDISGGLVELTADEFAEYLNDAEYYSGEYGPDVWGGLRTSARATVRAMRKVKTG